jgi:hypothetical protein
MIRHCTGDLDCVRKVVEAVDQHLHEMTFTYLKQLFQ